MCDISFHLGDRYVTIDLRGGHDALVRVFGVCRAGRSDTGRWLNGIPGGPHRTSYVTPESTFGERVKLENSLALLPLLHRLSSYHHHPSRLWQSLLPVSLH